MAHTRQGIHAQDSKPQRRGRSGEPLHSPHCFTVGRQRHDHIADEPFFRGTDVDSDRFGAKESKISLPYFALSH
jgi:hypothetical protein